MEIVAITLSTIAGAFVLLAILAIGQSLHPIFRTWVDIKVERMKAKHKQDMKYMDADS